MADMHASALLRWSLHMGSIKRCGMSSQILRCQRFIWPFHHTTKHIKSVHHITALFTKGKESNVLATRNNLICFRICQTFKTLHGQAQQSEELGKPAHLGRAVDGGNRGRSARCRRKATAAAAGCSAPGWTAAWSPQRSPRARRRPLLLRGRRASPAAR